MSLTGRPEWRRPSRSNQASGSNKPPGKGKGGADYDTYSVAVMVKWRINPRDAPGAHLPIVPGKMGIVLKKAFGDVRVSHIKDEGQLCHTEEGGWAIVGMRPEAAPVLERHGGDSDKQFSREWSEANRQPYVGSLVRSHHLDKSNAIAHRLRSGNLLAGPNGVVRPRDRDGTGDEGRKRRRCPSMHPPPPLSIYLLSECLFFSVSFCPCLPGPLGLDKLSPTPPPCPLTA